MRARRAVLELDICVTTESRLRLYDLATGEWLRTHQETETARRDVEVEIVRLREQLAQLQQQP